MYAFDETVFITTKKEFLSSVSKSCDLLPEEKKTSWSLRSHQLFGSSDRLVLAEQMRLEAESGVWFLSNYTISVLAASFTAFILKGDQRVF